MEVKQGNASFAINKMAAEASQAACCRSTMGPKMAAKLEADNDSGPHTTEAYYEEQDVRKVFQTRPSSLKLETSNKRCCVSRNKQQQTNLIRPLTCAIRTYSGVGTWQRNLPTLVLMLLTTILVLFDRQAMSAGSDQIATNQAILSTGKW